MRRNRDCDGPEAGPSLPPALLRVEISDCDDAARLRAQLVYEGVLKRALVKAIVGAADPMADLHAALARFDDTDSDGPTDCDGVA